MRCPKCNQEDCEELADEVDIGVGVQKFVLGYDCQNCGQLVVCHDCGRLEDDHAKWCTKASNT